MDQVQRELKAILDFYDLFLARSDHDPEEVVGFELRKFRKRELLRMAELMALRN